MNASVYIFGKFNGAYSQYPNDYTSEIFHKFYEKSKATTQIVIHRDDNLMYYGYIRKLNRECYIGFCIVLNCLMFTCIDKIFLLFENAISMLVIEGKFIHFNAQGEICNSVEELSLHKEEVFALEESLRVGVNALKNVAKALPTVSYGIQKDTFREFVVDDNLEAIIKSSYSNGYTYIYKDEGFDTVKLNSYKDVLVRLNNEKELLQDKLNKINRKKVYTFILFGALIICSIYLLSAYKSLKDTQQQLQEAHKIIIDNNDTITESRQKISELKKNINQLKIELNQKNELVDIYHKVMFDSKKYPILISNIEVGNMNNDGKMETDYGKIIYSSTSMFLSHKITYSSINNDTITLNVKLFGPDGKLSKGVSSPTDYSYSRKMIVTKGNNNTYCFSGWGNSQKGSWIAGDYRVEIWYNNVCLKSKKFTIHK